MAAAVGVDLRCDAQLVIIMLATKSKLNRYQRFFFILAILSLHFMCWIYGQLAIS